MSRFRTSPPRTTQDGIFFNTLTGTCWNRSGSAAAVGDVMALDLAASEGEVSSVGEGTADSVFANVIAPTSTSIASGIMCVSSAASVSDDASGTFTFEGLLTQVFTIDGAGGSSSIGDPAVATTAKNIDVQTASGERIIATVLQAQSVATRTLGRALFMGTPGGFGVA